MQELYKGLPRYHWPRVDISGKYRCRVRRHVWETQLAENFARYLPETGRSKFYAESQITPSDVPKILNEGHIPQYDTLCRYAASFGTTPDELVGEIREYETVTIEELWMFKDDMFRGMDEEVEVLELIEEYKPIDFDNVEDEQVADLIIGVAGRARQDIQEAEKGRKGANPTGAKTFLRELHSALTGEHGQKHKDQFNKLS